MYYDPLYPSVEATKNQIFRSIVVLQDKLRQRRQIDLDIQSLRSQQLMRRNDLAAYENQLRYRHSYLDAQNKFRSHVHDFEANEKVKYAFEEEEHNCLYFDRLRKLEREKLQLSRQRIHGSCFAGIQRPYSFERPYGQWITYDEDQQLVKKYEDGTRAKEFKNQLSSCGNTKRKYEEESPQTYMRNIKRPLAAQFNAQVHAQHEETAKNKTNKSKIAAKSQVKNYDANRSPYSKFKSDEDYGQTENKYRNQIEMNDENSDRPLNSKNVKEAAVTFGVNNRNLSSRGKSKSQNRLNLSRSKNEFNQNFGNYNNSSSKKSKNKDISSHKAIMNRSRSRSKQRSTFQSVEELANFKIANRLKLSQIVYEDSKFRNIKHEMNHLNNTYENQVKIRKDIKEKINNHPLVLRKHAMVVE